MNKDNFMENPEFDNNLMGMENNAQYDMCRAQYYNPAPIVNTRLAHAYVPFQYLECLYPPETGLAQGTVFPELDTPYGMDPEYTVDA